MIHHHSTKKLKIKTLEKNKIRVEMGEIESPCRRFL